MEILKTIGVSEGMSKAPILVLHPMDLTIHRALTQDATTEQLRAAAAIATAKDQLVALTEDARAAGNDETVEILEAHQMMMDDPDFIEGITHRVVDEQVSAEFACDENRKAFQAMFEALDNEYMRARAADVGDLSLRILKVLKGADDSPLDHITAPCIVVAEDLTPSDTAKIGTKPVVGFATRVGGRTSHSAIMARSMGIPAVAGIPESALALADGILMLLDGRTGTLILDPDTQSEEAFDTRADVERERRAQLAIYKDKAGSTQDGRLVVIEGNIGTPADATRVLEAGGEGVGLFRSEFLFMDRPDLPDEEEQFRAYKAAGETMKGRPVIIRTLDIGGDKEVPALDLPKEQNPFLGYRAIRICLDRTELFLVQLRALLRASAFADIRIMFPMISSIEEVRDAKVEVDKAKAQLREEKIAFNEDVKIGIMVEIPVAAICADILAREVDFFSIGTNDLIQYSCAVDRVNDKIASLYRPLHPGVLRLIQMTADAANAAGIEVGVCGEMAGTPGMAAILCGLGVTNLSMSASSILPAKAELAAHTFAQCQEKARALLSQAAQ